MKRYRYYDEEDEEYSEFPHSGLGVASFLIVLAMGIFEFGLVIIAGILESSSEEGIDENSAVATLLGVAMIGALMVNLLGMGLAIGGLCQPRRNKLFAGLGLGLGAVIFLGTCFLFIIGISTG